MAKKKGKKNNQKQVEVVSPPENLKAVNTTATEESSANEEAQQQTLPPPDDAPNNETLVTGSTSVPDHNIEAIQDTPSEDKASMVAKTSDNGETTEPVEDDHVHASEVAPEEDTVPSNADSELIAAAPEDKAGKPSAAEPHGIKEAEQPPTVLSDDSEAVLESNDPTELTSETISDDLLQPEHQDESFTPKAVEPTLPAVVEIPVTEIEPLDTAQAEVDAPLPADPKDGAPNLEDTASTEPAVAATEQKTQ